MVVLLTLSCAQRPDPDKKYADIGGAASAKLMQSLKGALAKAIADSGISGAIRVCSDQALAITAEIDAQSDSITDIRRITDRFRNPHNAPDQADLDALAFFRGYQTEHDGLPAYHIVRSAGELRYYQPLVIQPLCLNCHGKSGSMDDQTIAAINRLYPEDMAVGYDLGDLRGLVRVTIRQ